MLKSTHKLHAAVALLALSGAALAHADENHFAGPYVVVSNEWKHASVKVDGEKISKSEAAPSIGVGYTFGIDHHATLGLKATFDAKSGEYGVGETALSTSAETVVKEKSHYSIAVEPGYAINDQILVFGILAYHGAKAELLTGDTALGRSSLSGFGYGVGAKYALPNHFFLMAELQKVNYQGKTIAGSEVKPSSTVAAVGIGYHF